MTDAVDLFSDWAHAGRGEPMGQQHARRATAALEALHPQPGEAFVDLGCGEGWATRWLAERVGSQGRVVGLDGSTAMLERARRTSTTATYTQGNLLALPFADGSFQGAFSMETLYYVDIDAALAEVARVLAPGGRVAICTDFYTEHAASHAWPEQLGLVMDLRDTQGWQEALERAGFTEVRSTRLRDPSQPEHPGTLAVYGQR